MQFQISKAFSIIFVQITKSLEDLIDYNVLEFYSYTTYHHASLQLNLYRRLFRRSSQNLLSMGFYCQREAFRTSELRRTVVPCREHHHSCIWHLFNREIIILLMIFKECGLSNMPINQTFSSVFSSKKFAITILGLLDLHVHMYQSV